MGVLSSAVWIKRFALVLGPTMFFILAFLVPLSGLSPAGAIVLGVVAWMALWWMSECVPLPATALLPIVIFPLAGVMRSADVFSAYSNNIIFLFLGGFILAGALEKWGLHRRVAMNIIRILGTSVNRIILGFMIATSMLTFIVTNAAATMMMIPMALAVIKSIKESGVDESNEDLIYFQKSLVLGIGYSATIFGMSTILGGTSIPFFISHTNAEYGISITFAQFASFGVPFAAVFLALFWLYLTRLRYPTELRDIPGGREIVEEQCAALGRMSGAERVVACVVILVAGLWIGQAWLIKPYVPEITDGMIAAFGAIVLFMLPSGQRSSPRIMEWKDTHNVPWGVLLLLGGGFALAGAVDQSGLSLWVGDQFIGLAGVPTLVFIFIMVVALAFITEFTSTGATAILFVPLMGAVATALGHDPLFVMLAATLAVNCAFMLPAATPANSVMYGTGLITIKDMVATGFAVTLLGIVVIIAALYTWAPVIFDISIGW